MARVLETDDSVDTSHVHSLNERPEALKNPPLTLSKPKEKQDTHSTEDYTKPIVTSQLLNTLPSPEP